MRLMGLRQLVGGVASRINGLAKESGVPSLIYGWYAGPRHLVTSHSATRNPANFFSGKIFFSAKLL